MMMKGVNGRRSLAELRVIWCGIGQGTDLRESCKLLRDRYRTDG